MIRSGSRPGDVRLRRGRRRSQVVEVAVRRRRRFEPRLWMVPAAFAVAILLGAVLLSLPWASESRTWTRFPDSLFTSASAVCVTGLVRFDTAEHWSLFGEVVIALLIQGGGLGVTMYAGALLLVLGRRFGLNQRRFFGMELTDVRDHDIRRLLRRAMLFTVVVEGSTFILLLPWWLSADLSPQAVWEAFFTALSAFNNAGFDLMGDGAGFVQQVDNPYPLVVMGVSALLGSTSFITVFGMTVAPSRWTVDTRFVVYGMSALLVVGILVLVIGEAGAGGALESLGSADLAANAFFLSVNRTTGMATIDMAQLNDATTAALLVLMFIGGASTSTAGGIKIGAFMVSLVVVLSTLRGMHRAEAFGREIPLPIVQRSIAITLIAFAIHVIGTWLVLLTDGGEFLPVLFETMSALANVGWSQSLTPTLSDAGAAVLVVLMYLGRLGPLLIALSLPDTPAERYRYPLASVRIG